MTSRILTPRLVAGVFLLALPLLGAPASAQENSIFWRGHNYCWYDIGWNGAGWYRCGFDKNTGHGWGGPKGWAGASGTHPSSGAWFELPPPTPPVSAPSIATERYVEPLKGGAAAGSPAGGPLRR